MIPSSNRSKKNLIIVVCIIFGLLLLLIIRIGWIQIVKGAEYSEMAIEQQTKDTPIEAERGAIYDTNGKELAVSVTCYTVWLRPTDIKDPESKKKTSYNIEKVTRTLSENLGMEYDEVKKLVTKEQSIIKVKKGINKQTADKIRKEKLPGIEIAEDTKRDYPLGSFASHTIGGVTDDNTGLSGLELQYNTVLSGVAGRWINYTDTSGNRLSYGKEKYYKAEDGYSVVTTIDQVVQHYTEKALETVKKNTKADRVMAIVMDPKSGDILAMAQTPGFDLNNPKVPTDAEEKKKLESMNDSQKVGYWNKMWRNSLINDVYEPGSTFKLLTTAIALEEGVATPNSTFNCTGAIRVADRTIHCHVWEKGRSHGHQNLSEAVKNSCNPVFVQLATRVGIDKFYEHLGTFGITGRTGIDFPGETTAILQSKENAGPVGLATVGFGQGIAVTPIQLITAISSFGNDGKLMKPRLVKELKDSKGNTVQQFNTEVVRQTVSKETADEMCDIMQFVVDSGGGKTFKVDGYNVGGKTGTANKPKNGKYSNETYSSCIAMAPMDNPQVAVLVIVDNPKGVHYGSVVAGPGVKQILTDTLRYLNISPSKETQEKNDSEKIEVPNVAGLSVGEARKALQDKGLSYDMDKAAGDDFVVSKQYPAAGTKVKKGSKVFLYKD